MNEEIQPSNIPSSLKLYTVAETAAILSVSTKSVYTWIKEEALTALRLGPGQRYLRIREADLEAFIAQQDF
jgi:excisionase family DNA binding protein